MSGRPTQFASKTGVETTGLFLCFNEAHPPLLVFAGPRRASAVNTTHPPTGLTRDRAVQILIVWENLVRVYKYVYMCVYIHM